MAHTSKKAFKQWWITQDMYAVSDNPWEEKNVSQVTIYTLVSEAWLAGAKHAKKKLKHIFSKADKKTMGIL